jgi:hypothetical protein
MTMARWFPAAMVAVACTLDIGDFTGKTCATANDCPADYVCVNVRPGVGSTCELLALPDFADGGSGGPPADYCHDVKPILDRSCVSNCHGADTTGSQIDRFRLDFYEAQGSVQGAKEQAANIQKRTAADTMPPPGSPEPRTNLEERALIKRWVESGTPFCLDAGTPDGGADGG